MRPLKTLLPVSGMLCCGQRARTQAPWRTAVRGAVAFFCGVAFLRADPAWVREGGQPGDFPLATAEAAAPIFYDAGDHRVVGIAAGDLAADVERVTGRKLDVRVAWEPAAPAALPGAVLVGTLGKSPLVDAVIANAKLDVTGLRGAWESFVIATVDKPLPGVARGLLIVGSDRRGTAFGIYELSQAIGVSPWHWWSDVAPARKAALHVAAGTRRFGPPSVKYRGIFINDEDWGLQPWAAKTFEPEHGDIGPKTYARVFELLLRLKANTLWPAMHECTKPFNFFPENRRVADDYAIVMGSSHAEPMLRNNVGEWKDEKPKYNYITNREGVLAYWEQRMKENGAYENIYTLGMRGIHDSGIQGAKTDAERIKVLEQVFADQRGLIEKYARPVRAAGRSATGSPIGTSGSTPEPVPQMFCAYKEVLGLYRQGLRVPDDVTIVWPDDNFGFIRNFATPEEQKRSGGFGVYYHISYLGAPLAYLWLHTTPPALIWQEMAKAYEHGARAMWIVNVGDIKPAEIGTEFFLQMAWDIEQWRRENVPDFLREWAAREFGPAQAAELAAIKREYFELNFQRKPEHLQWWLPKQPLRPSPLTRAEIDERLARFAQLTERVEAVERQLRPEQREGYFELVKYPVVGTALANERYFAGELAAFEGAEPKNGGAEAPPATKAGAPTFSDRALAADAALAKLTQQFDEIAAGKWRGFMRVEPADSQWSFRIKKWELPKYAPEVVAEYASRKAGGGGGRSGRHLSVEAEAFAAPRAGAHGRWEVIPGLGRTGDSIAVFPTTAPIVALADAAKSAPAVEYVLDFPQAGTFKATFHAIPTQPIVAGRGLRFALGVDDGAPREVLINVRDGSSEWAQGVLNATITGTAELEIAAPGKRTLRLYGTDAGVVLDKIVIDLGGLEPSYLGPKAP